jgi:hypothetical protein
MTLHPIPSEFPVYEENFVFFFMSVGSWVERQIGYFTRITERLLLFHYCGVLYTQGLEARDLVLVQNYILATTLQMGFVEFRF